MVFNDLLMCKRLLFVWIFIAFLVNTISAQSIDGLTVIGNKTGLSSVNRATLKKIFEGNSSSIWKTGEHATVVMPSAKSDFGVQFSEKMLNRSYPSLQKIWLVQVFQGRADAPVFKNSSFEILEYVKSNPGAIGVVKMAEKDIPDGFLIPVIDR
jgi:ABC-type phosphate transport system substrate-binding protein